MPRQLRARGVAVVMLLWLFPATAGSQFTRTRAAPAGGDAGQTSPGSLDPVQRWHSVMLAANALDHTPVAPGEPRTFGEQIGPGRTARAFAIVQIAVSDTLNAIFQRYTTYSDVPVVVGRTSWEAAVATAAHRTLAAMYPSQSRTFDGLLIKDLAALGDPLAVKNGVALGQQVAMRILALRTSDGSDHDEPEVGVEFILSDQPGYWRPDPISQADVALGAYWGEVSPFVAPAENLDELAPPELTSPAYAAAFNEVRDLGGDGIVTPTRRSLDQTIAGIYWGYDGTAGLGTPPRLYNQIARHIADLRGSDVVDLARLLALLNVAVSDSSVACWAEKYQYQVWRPVTAIREADAGTGPTGLGDGNPETRGDPKFTPLGAPASNSRGPNFTPPFPAYASGHAALGGAAFQTLRRVYGTDAIAFAFVSDEFNGITRDNLGLVRPRIVRRFASLSAAEEENGQSRIYLGIHWAFDKTRGIASGRHLADYVYDHAFQKRSSKAGTVTTDVKQSPR
jgi:hypothetical protein